jgi:hypothetical protein
MAAKKTQVTTEVVEAAPMTTNIGGQITFVDGKYAFNDINGTTTEVVIWLEKSKANEKNPDGKAWIKLPKVNSSNRAYFSLSLFNELGGANGTPVNVSIKTAAPRVLGNAGPKTDLAKHLDEAKSAEYINLITTAQEAYKAQKSTGKKKLEEMTKEELEAVIAAIETGTPISSVGPKSFVDMFTAEQMKRYQELTLEAETSKKNAPRPERRKLTDAEKAAAKVKRDANTKSKAMQLLAALTGGAPVAVAEAPVEEDFDEDFDEDFGDDE